MFIIIYTPAVVMVIEISCPLMVVVTLLLIVKHSTALSIVTGLELMVVWLSLPVSIQLFEWDTTEILCCLCGIQLTTTVEDEDGRIAEGKPMYRDQNIICMKWQCWKHTLGNYMCTCIDKWNVPVTVNRTLRLIWSL